MNSGYNRLNQGEKEEWSAWTLPQAAPAAGTGACISIYMNHGYSTGKAHAAAEQPASTLRARVGSRPNLQHGNGLNKTAMFAHPVPVSSLSIHTAMGRGCRVPFMA